MKNIIIKRKVAITSKLHIYTNMALIIRTNLKTLGSVIYSRILAMHKGTIFT